MTDRAEALVSLAPGRAAIETVDLPPMAPGTVEVRTLFSALSRGTERLVYEGRVPDSEHTSMRAPFQSGDFPFPVRYGYAAVGVVEDGPDALLGRHVFALYPHQSRFRVPAGAVVPVPSGVPPARAVLAAGRGAASQTAFSAVSMFARTEDARRDLCRGRLLHGRNPDGRRHRRGHRPGARGGG